MSENDWPISAAEYLKRPVPKCEPLPDDELGAAIKATWRKEHADYLALIHSRYRKMPIGDAIKCVRLGYSSPAHAMTEGVVRDYR